MAYSTEIREKALRQYLDGHTEEQITAKLGVSKHTLGNWKRLLLATGSLEKKKVKRKSGTPYKYKPEKLKALLDESRSSETVTASKDSKAQGSSKAKGSKKGKKDKKKKVSFLLSVK